MRNSISYLPLFVVTFFFGCNQKATIQEVDRFDGLWTLHVMEQYDPESGEWTEWREGMQGYILYDSKDHMSVHLTSRGYQNTNIQFPNFVDTISLEALKHLTNSYVYFANYTLLKDEGIVEHARISHSNPSEWNQVVRRRYRFSGDTLILEPMEENNAGLRLKWIRSSETAKD